MKGKKFEVVSMDFLKEDIKKSNDKDPVFTKEEAQQLMDVMIKDSCMWKLREFYPEQTNSVSALMELPYSSTYNTADVTIAQSPTDEELEDIADKVYRSIVKEWRYSAVTLQVCRKSDFSYESVLDKVKECNDEMTAKKEDTGKALIRSIERVKERGIDITKAVTLEEIVETGIARPERVVTFINMVNKER